MAENIVTLHPAPVKRPLTAAERGRRFRERQKLAAAAKSGQPAEKPQTFGNGERNEREQNERETTRVRPVLPQRERTGLPPDPPFADLEKATAELVASCQRGIEAARQLFGRSAPPALPD